MATLSAILEGAAQVLETDGFERMTTTRVAERAGTSVGTLYQYFPSKEALLVAIVQARMAAIDRALATVFDLPASAPLAEHVRVMITALITEKSVGHASTPNWRDRRHDSRTYGSSRARSTARTAWYAR